MNEVEAILVTAALASIIAIYGVITQRVITRRSQTLEYLSRTDSDRDLIVARQKFIEVTASGHDILQYAESKNFFMEGACALRLVLNEYEKMAIGLQYGVYDRGIIIRHCRGMILRDWEISSPFIQALRKETKNSKIYAEFEDLVKLVQSGRRAPRSYFWRLWF